MKQYCVIWGDSDIRAYAHAESPEEAVNKVIRDLTLYNGRLVTLNVKSVEGVESSQGLLPFSRQMQRLLWNN